MYDQIFVCQIKTTCWEKNDKLENKEVIELGGCLLSVNTLQTSDAFSVIVKPKNDLSLFCQKKTGLMPEDVSSGISFLDLMEFVEEYYDVSCRPWASYGSFAYDVIRHQSQRENSQNYFSNRFINIKSFFPLIFNLRYEIGLKEAIRKLKLEIPPSKDARDEAINASIVLKEILRGPQPL